MMQPPSILGALKNWGLKKLGLNRTFDFVVTVSLARFHKAKRLKVIGSAAYTFRCKNGTALWKCKKKNSFLFVFSLT